MISNKTYNTSMFFIEKPSINTFPLFFVTASWNAAARLDSYNDAFVCNSNLFDIYKKKFNIINLEDVILENPTFTNEINYDDFFYFKNSSYISFFLNNMIDVPVCFKKSPSLKRKSFELPNLKLFNLIMRQGKKEKTIRNLLSNYFEIKYLNKLNLNNNSLFSTFYFDSLIFYFYDFLTFFNLSSKQIKNFDNFWDLEEKPSLLRFNYNFRDVFLTNIEKISPVFAYFIYSVDKNVRKYSRGKSGKYIFIWKYIASYKRKYQALRWVAKELKFRFEKKFFERFNAVIFNLQSKPETTFAWKSKVFSHNYVFRNFKKTLMTSLNTVVK
uniref:Ribosomal protein S7 n=1 Tax=Stylonychia lemnae TaxID=5949 RepID=A0A3S6KA33_STYLE|nr:ribosomal protein S7 [Stylonychia lemnae]